MSDKVAPQGAAEPCPLEPPSAQPPEQAPAAEPAAVAVVAEPEPAAEPAAVAVVAEPESAAEPAAVAVVAEPEPATAAAPAEVDGAVPAPGRKGRASRIVAIVVGALVLVLVVGGIAGVVLYLTRDQPTAAAAGDCLSGQGVDPTRGRHEKVDLKIVDCGASSAAYKVLGRVENQPESEANADSRLCDSYQGTEFIYWEGVRGEHGTVLCIASNER